MEKVELLNTKNKKYYFVIPEAKNDEALRNEIKEYGAYWENKKQAWVLFCRENDEIPEFFNKFQQLNRNSRHLILTTRVLVLCTVLLYSTHSLQFVFTRSVLYCGWTLHFKLRIYFVHLFYRLRGQQVFRKYLNNLILEY